MSGQTPAPTSTSTSTLKITAMPIADAAKMLAAAYGRRITEAMIHADIAAGAPVNPDPEGTINLIHYTAWLAREVAHGD